MRSDLFTYAIQVPQYSIHLTIDDKAWWTYISHTNLNMFIQIFVLPNDVIGHQIHNKAWMLATAIADGTLITFATHPSGRHLADIEQLNIALLSERTVLELKPSRFS